MLLLVRVTSTTVDPLWCRFPFGRSDPQLLEAMPLSRWTSMTLSTVAQRGHRVAMIERESRLESVLKIVVCKARAAVTGRAVSLAGKACSMSALLVVA